MVNGDDDILALLKKVSPSGSNIKSIPAGFQALTEVQQKKPHFIIVNGVEGLSTDISFLEAIKGVSSDSHMALITAQSEAEFIISAIRVGIEDVFPYPIKPKELGCFFSRFNDQPKRNKLIDFN